MSKAWTATLYGSMVLGTIALFLLIRSYGEGLTAPPPAVSAGSSTAAAQATSGILFHILLALAAVIVAGRTVGKLLSLIGQPPVIGEAVGGILLGPSLLGRLPRARRGRRVAAKSITEADEMSVSRSGA